MRESIAVDTVCEFVQAALTYQQTTLQEECLCFIEDNTEVYIHFKGNNVMHVSYTLKSMYTHYKYFLCTQYTYRLCSKVVASMKCQRMHLRLF